MQIVFSDAFWVGKKEENPDEARLDFPEELYEVSVFHESYSENICWLCGNCRHNYNLMSLWYQGKHPEVDFEGGAGSTPTRRKDFMKVVTKSTEEESLPGSPIDETEVISPERCQNLIDLENSTPVRQSGRTAGKRFKYETFFLLHLNI